MAHKEEPIHPQDRGEPHGHLTAGTKNRVRGISPTGAERHQRCSHGFTASNVRTVSSQGTWYCISRFPTSLTLWLLLSYCDKIDEALLSLYLGAPPRKSHTRCSLWLSYKYVAQAGLTACIDLRSKMGYFQFLIRTYWGLLEWGAGISFKSVMHKPLRPKYWFFKSHMPLEVWAWLFFSDIPRSFEVLLGYNIKPGPGWIKPGANWPDLTADLALSSSLGSRLREVPSHLNASVILWFKLH